MKEMLEAIFIWQGAKFIKNLAHKQTQNFERQLENEKTKNHLETFQTRSFSDRNPSELKN